MEADFGRDFLETSNKILKITDRICKIPLKYNNTPLKTTHLWSMLLAGAVNERITRVYQHNLPRVYAWSVQWMERVKLDVTDSMYFPVQVCLN